jgi:hypothetical protein
MNNVAGVKLDPNKSRYKTRENKKTQVDFEKEVSEFQKNELELQKKAAELSGHFLKMVQDKTVPENKGIIGADVEKGIIQSIARFALTLNNDETHDEGLGSVGAIIVLFNSVLMLRDRINELSHEIHLLRKDKESSGKE